MRKRVFKFVISFAILFILILSRNNTERVFADSIDPNTYIKEVKIVANSTGNDVKWFKGYEIKDGKIILKMETAAYAKRFWEYTSGAALKSQKLIIDTEDITKIAVNNPIIIPKGYLELEKDEKGIIDFEAGEDDWKSGVNFPEFGFYHVAKKTKYSFFSKDTPPEFTFTTTSGETFMLPWEVVEYKEEEVKFEIRVNPETNNKNRDKEIEVGVLVGDELIGEKMVELEVGKTYTILAKDGTRTKFKEWKLTTNKITDLETNFKSYFGGEKTVRELSFTLTEELMEKIKALPENQRNIVLEANYNEYTSVEIELKEKIEDIDSSKMSSRVFAMMEYSMETEEYKEKIELLKNNINNNYTHKLYDEKGEAYIILKDKDGNLKEKIASSLNEDIILAYSSILGRQSDVVELIAVPKEGYKFEKWQIITPAMDIESEWDIPIENLNPESGISAETISPYIKTELQAMQKKDEGHRFRFRARAIFKSIGEAESEEIEKIEEIHKEYIKGYTEISDIFPKTVEVKLKDKDVKIGMAVDWNIPDLDEITTGEKTIEGKLKDFRFEQDKAYLYLTVNEIVEILQSNYSNSLINSDFFGYNGKSYNLPNQVEVKLSNGESEETRELDVEWADQPLLEDESYKIVNGTIFYYKHGNVVATGNIKGYDNNIQYELKIIPGNIISFYIDDDFKEASAGKYSYKQLNSQEIKKGELIPEPELPIRLGYIHLGWYKDASGANPLDPNTGTKFDFTKPLGEEEMSVSSVSLYNKWREVFIDNVEFMEIEVGAQLSNKLKINTTDKDIVEVSVKGWEYTGVDLSTPGEYTIKATIEWRLKDEKLDVKVIVKDKGEEKQIYTVNFDTNGGNHISSIEVEEGEKLTKPTEPIRNRYGFAGWYKNEGLTQEFDFDTLITENLTLYAKWEEEPVSKTLEITSVELIKDGKEISKTEKKGNTFTLTLPKGYDEKIDDRWHYLIIEGTEGSNLAQDRGADEPIENWAAGNISNNIEVGEIKKFTISKDGESRIYYIEIKSFEEEIQRYTVNFNSNGGNSISPQEVEEGGKAVKPSNPTINGYSFIGWYKNSNLTQAFDFNTPIDGNITLYAKWEKEPTNELPRILKFSLLGYEASIDDRNERITINIPYNMDLSNLVPSITITDGASISPIKDSAVNFNRTVYYTVYGSGNTQKTYRVIINIPSDRDSRYWDDYYDNYKKERDDYYKRRGEISWWELAKEAKEKRAEELKIKSERDEKLVLKERAKILNDVGRIESRARNSRSSLMINDRFNHIEIRPTVSDFKSGFSNIITIPKDVLPNLLKGEYEFIKYHTGVVNIEIYPSMETASGLKLNLSDIPKDIRDKWNKMKGKGYIFQVESDSTKGGLSYEINLEKQYPVEKLRFVKYNYMKGNFEDVSPEKWYVFNGKLRCDKVSSGIYGIIYKD